MRRLIPLLSLVLALTGCGRSPVPPEGERWDLERISPRDLGHFQEEHETVRSEYALLEGEEWELTVTRLQGAEPGPVIYVVGGIHGDEIAGWHAGELLKQADIRAGTVYVLAPANEYGAEHDRRTTRSDRDLNRNFPGNSEGWDAERLAAAIFADIRDKEPDLLLDLHEARPKQEGRDALGNSIIVEDVEGLGDLVLDILLDSEAGEIGAHPLTLYGSPPEGSINRTVTRELGIPAITVETLRSEELACRVADHLAFAEYVFAWYNVL